MEGQGRYNRSSQVQAAGLSPAESNSGVRRFWVREAWQDAQVDAPAKIRTVTSEGDGQSAKKTMQKMREKREKREKGLARKEIDCQCAGRLLLRVEMCELSELSELSPGAGELGLRPPSSGNAAH